MIPPVMHQFLLLSGMIMILGGGVSMCFAARRLLRQTADEEYIRTRFTKPIIAVEVTKLVGGLLLVGLGVHFIVVVLGAL